MRKLQKSGEQQENLQAKNIIGENQSSYIANTYRRYKIQIERARGIKIWDRQGNEYIDTFMGIGVLLFGHNHDYIIKRIKEKIDRYIHISNFFLDDDAEFIAKRLVQETAKSGKVFFTNSGAESTECALKVIKKFRKKGKIVSFLRNFHGRTLKALSITGFDSIRTQFTEDENVVFLSYEPEEVEEFFKNNDISAVFVETVHGSGGLDVIPKEIVEIINTYKPVKEFILVADEVQSGLGRTGKFYAYQHFDISPDIVTVAKGIGGGLPLGACILLGEYSDAFLPGEHGTTFAPNPVALAGGRAVLEMIDSNTLKRVNDLGKFFDQRFSSINVVKEIRGLGLMKGIVVDERIKLSVEDFLENELLVNILSNGVIRFLLPLNIDKSEIEMIVQLFEKTVSKKFKA
ncbi:MAG: aspartate aminotransferase family protein [Fervidobacterium sp.]